MKSSTLRGVSSSVRTGAIVQRLAAGALALGLVGLFACGAATIGDPCEMPGSTEECVEDAVCDTLKDGEVLCLLICQEQADCPSDFDCNGVSGSSLKACHPKTLK